MDTDLARERRATRPYPSRGEAGTRPRSPSIALFDLWMALGPRDAPIFFPGARAAADLGAGAGDAGPVSRSLRLPDAVTHERFVDTWAAAVAPALASFRPALVVLSLGLDGAEGESEGARLAPETYAFRQKLRRAFLKSRSSLS